MSLKDSWKKAGVGLGHAAKDLGKAFADTAKVSVRKVNEWANSEDEAEDQQKNAAEPEIIEAEVVYTERK